MLKIYNRFMTVLLGLLMVLALSIGSAFAAPNQTGKNAIQCFGDPNSCHLINKTTAYLSTETGSGASVFIPNYNGSFYDVRTSLITNLSNTVSGSTLGIDPRWSIPIDSADLPYTHDGTTDYWIFVSFADCNNGAGLVDVLNDTTCTLNRSDTGGTYPNWATFSTTTNTYIAFDNYAFIVADGSGAPGTWTIGNVKIGKPGK